MVWIEQDSNGLVDMQDLENKLKVLHTFFIYMYELFAIIIIITIITITISLPYCVICCHY